MELLLLLNPYPSVLKYAKFSILNSSSFRFHICGANVIVMDLPVSQFIVEIRISIGSSASRFTFSVGFVRRAKSKVIKVLNVPALSPSRNYLLNEKGKTRRSNYVL